MKSNFTPAAIEQIAKAEQTIALLRADLQGFNTAITTGGTGSTAERLANNCLLAILDRLAPVHHGIKDLATAILEDRKNP